MPKRPLKKVCLYSLFLIWLSLCQPIFAQSFDPQTVFNEANNLYTAAKYRDALALYKTLDSLGYESGELYYNLGNAYYKLGQIGNTILYYEKARLFLEGDEDLENNLDLALARIKDKIPQLPQFFLESILQSVLDAFSIGVLATISLLLLYGAIAVVILQLRDMFNLNHLFGNILKYALLTLFIVFAALFAVKSIRLASHQNAVVVSPVVNLKSEPREQSSTVSVIHEGLKLEVTRLQSDWLEVKLPDGTKGWILRREAGLI